MPFLPTPLLPGGLPLHTLLLIWGSSLLFGFVLGAYHRWVASLGPKLPVYVVLIVSFTAFFHVAYQGMTRPLAVGPVLLYALGSLVSGLAAAWAGLWVARSL